MTITRALINPETLALARKEAGYKRVEDAAHKLSFARGKAQKLAAMEAGEDEKARPTPNQVRELARVYGVDEGLFYLPPERAHQEIPDISDIHDFRMAGDRRKTPELIQLLRGVVARQQLLGEMLEEEERPDLSWMGKYRSLPPAKIASALRKIIWQDDAPATGLGDWIEKAEQRMGVAVMQPHPHHSRSVKGQMSGVALGHGVLPVVVLNAGDGQQRRLFTLLHELAHLMIQRPGISKIDSESGAAIPEDQEEERICDAVAANAIIPPNIFNTMWKQHQEPTENIKHLHRKTGASASACAVRAFQFEQIDRGTMVGLLTIYRKQHQAKQEREKAAREKRRRENDNAGGGGPHPKFIARDNVGPRIALKSLLAYDEGRISTRDLYDIFGVKLKHLTAIAETVNYEMVRWRPPAGEYSQHDESPQ